MADGKQATFARNQVSQPSPVSGTFGLDSGNYACNQRANALQAMRFQNTVGSGDIIRLELLFSSPNSSGKVRMGVYADNNGTPGNLLLDAGEAEVSDGWISLKTQELPVIFNEYYWLAFNLKNENVIVYQDPEPANSHYRINDYTYGALPTKFPEGALLNNAEYVMRAIVSGYFTLPAVTPASSPIPTITSATPSHPSITTVSGTGQNRTSTPNRINNTKFDITNCRHEIVITIDHTKINLPLTDFPVMIHLSPSSGIGQTDVSAIFKALGDRSKKIAITTSNRTTECNIEIQSWDSLSQQAWLWVKVPYISNIEDTILYLYYDPDQADNDNMAGNTGSIPAEQVWSDHYVMVQHLEETSSGSIGEFIDSTSRHNDGTGFGYPDLKTGKVGSAQYFDGDNDYIIVPDSDDLSLNTTWGLTVSWWLGPTELNWRNNDGSGNYINMLGKGGYPGGWEWVFGLGLQTSQNKPQQINLYHHNTPGGRGIGAGTSLPYTTGEWIYVVGRFDNQNVDILDFYPEGLKTDHNIYNKATGYSDAIEPKNTWSPLTIGTIVTQWQMYEGLIDEVHISNVPRSDDWIKASYYAESDNLVKYQVETSDGEKATITDVPTTVSSASQPAPTENSPTNIINSETIPADKSLTSTIWKPIFIISGVSFAIVFGLLLILWLYHKNTKQD